MELSDEIISVLRCPKCFSQLDRNSESLICSNDECKAIFPVVNNVPVLINEENSIFNIRDFIEQRDTTIKTNKSIIRKTLASMIPSINKNLKANENYARFMKKLLSFSPSPKILILGSGVKGEGTDILLKNPSVKFFESDVSFGPKTEYIIDAHNIPFADSYFDGVIVQAVLEHVLDPFRCVQEIYRVLKKNGFVYAETPFMQQVHEGKYDFHRFTHLGHRRLFRNFTEIDSGPICGPGMALAWACNYFIYSFFDSKKMRRLLFPITHLLTFFLKYFDYYLIDKPGSYDAASAFFFWGQKNETLLKDAELIKMYKGLL